MRILLGNAPNDMPDAECAELDPILARGDIVEVEEDPPRRELYRLWLGRNCNFINNFVPSISSASLANMDFPSYDHEV